MRNAIVLKSSAVALVTLFATAAHGGTITAQGNVVALTNRNQIPAGAEGRFDEGPTSGAVPLNLYSNLGLTFRAGAFSSFLPNSVTTGTAFQAQYDTADYYPAPIGGGGQHTGAGVYWAGVATFSVPVTRVGLTASRNGTQYLTAFRANGTIIGQVTWVPANDSQFIGLDTVGVPIAAIAYGNDDLFSGAVYNIGGSTIFSDTWVWGGCDHNGIVDAGEQCDDGNAASGDGCSPYCVLEYCGDGVVQPGEACDDHNTLSGDGCASDCHSNETCGNGHVDVAKGEACDDGNNINGDGCQANCSLPKCGDGILDAGEICDDGNHVGGDGCNATCTSTEACGNGVVDTDAGEQCDDANTADGDGCSSTCDLEYCGNGTVDPGEVCDDDNTGSGDGCASDCKSDESCGNGTPDTGAGEQCDDGNGSSGDGCSSSCQFEICGNGTVDPGEACDDGNTLSGDGCSSDCESDETCGNGVVDFAAGEACDDGNTLSGDGCQSDCSLPSCGDGVVDDAEECDDGNHADGDGCNATCTSDETCGNGIVDGGAGEQCDDGNTAAGDGCAPSCVVEYCGNAEIDPGEICDDGNTSGGDGCSADCSSDETCGNGYVDTAAGEQCDLGDDNGNGRCTATCAIATSGEGEGGGAEGGGEPVGGDGAGGGADDGGSESGGCDCRASAGATESGASSFGLAVCGLLLGLVRRRRQN